MKYECSNGHENYAAVLPERCSVCGSGLLRIGLLRELYSD